MKIGKFSHQGLSFVIIFAVIGVLAYSTPLAEIIGAESSNFTLFDLLAPIPVAFLGLWAGLAAILISTFTAIITLGKALDILTFARLLPPLAAGLFFYAYKQNKSYLSKISQFLLPAIAIALFMLHPAIFGTVAMLYSLYWLIPIASHFLPNHLFLRSLGATFSQHAIGSVLFLYLLPSLHNPAIWLALIPVVAIERSFFALGISISFKAVQFALNKFNSLLKYYNHQPIAFPYMEKRK
ncbi:MAG: hypothetical protein ABIH83_04005 [Candidatus Micrarchaeota archaeon]